MNDRRLATFKERWREILAKGQELTFRKGQVLFYEGHAPYGLFVVQSGKVRFSSEGGRCPGGHVWFAPEGEALGMTPLLEESAYCCTGTASTDCRVVFISKKILLSVIAPYAGTS